MESPQPEKIDQGKRTPFFQLAQWKKYFGLAGSILMPIFILIALLLIYRNSKEIITQQIKVDIRWLGVAFVLQWSGFFVLVLAWRLIIRAFDVRLPFWTDLRIMLYSAIGWIIPGSIWPYVMRPSLYQQKNTSAFIIVVSTLIENLTTGMGALVLYLIVSLYSPIIRVWEKPWIGVVAAIAFLVLLHPKIFNQLLTLAYKKTKNGEPAPPQGKYHYSQLLLWTGIEGAVILIGGISEYFILKSYMAVQLQWIISMITAYAVANAAGNILFVFPGASFIKDGAMTLVLTTFLPLPAALFFVAITRIWSMAGIVVVAGGAWLMIDLPSWLKTRKKATLNP